MRLLALCSFLLAAGCTTHSTTVRSEPGATVFVEGRAIGTAPTEYDDADYQGGGLTVRVRGKDGRETSVRVVREPRFDARTIFGIPLGATLVSGVTVGWVWLADAGRRLEELTPEERFSAGEGHAQACVLLASCGSLCAVGGLALMGAPFWAPPLWVGPDEISVAIPKSDEPQAH